MQPRELHVSDRCVGSGLCWGPGIRRTSDCSDCLRRGQLQQCSVLHRETWAGGAGRGGEGTCPGSPWDWW